MYDIHTHFIPSEVLIWLKDHAGQVNAVWEKGWDTPSVLTVNGKWPFELRETLIELSVYREEQTKAGVGHSMISPIPQLFLYDFPAHISTEISGVYNDALADITSCEPGRFSALATVPLNAPDQAALVLNKAVGKGLKGCIIGTGFGDRLLSDDDFIPFWEEANRLKAIVFIHPLLCEDPRLKRKKMPNLIGVPWETTICAADLLLSGMLDRYPHVKILLAHGGGFLPYQIGRVRKGAELWPAVSKDLQSSPEDYLKRFWYDSVLWNPQAYRLLIDLAGEDRVVPGSDFPFDLSQWPPAPCGMKGIETLFG